ncbi:delta-adaptin [Striga asiatica]|uniref:Delta-adaptin n=1 Tax=Striga asiatica TaxID=4170 RepID=A0A5A7RKT2_STRAF|nr:delta-adaptin [Striga asiatica]
MEMWRTNDLFWPICTSFYDMLGRWCLADPPVVAGIDHRRLDGGRTLICVLLFLILVFSLVFGWRVLPTMAVFASGCLGAAVIGFCCGRRLMSYFPPAQQPSPMRPSKSPTPSPKPTPTKTQQSVLSPEMRARTPSPSPKVIKPDSDNESPKTNKPLSHPPSPLTLPPPQIKTDSENESEPRIEQKNVLVQEIIGKQLKNHNNNPHTIKGKSEPSNGSKKKVSDSEDLGMRVITLAGENRGAIMQLSPSHKKTRNNLAKYASSSDGQGSGVENGGEDKSKNKEKNGKNAAVPAQPMTGFFNSNVQGINNSILYNAKCGHNDPGIHVSLIRKPNGDRKHHG